MQEAEQEEIRTILDIVREKAEARGVLSTFYATDSGNFWAQAEEQDSYPACGLYEAAGAMTVDSVGCAYPRYELYLIVEGGTMDERLCPSSELAAARAQIMGIVRGLRPWILGAPPSIVNFARADSLYSMWVELSMFDPNAVCPDGV